jgi:hypothetical protein
MPTENFTLSPDEEQKLRLLFKELKKQNKSSELFIIKKLLIALNVDLTTMEY